MNVSSTYASTQNLHVARRVEFPTCKALRSRINVLIVARFKNTIVIGQVCIFSSLYFCLDYTVVYHENCN